MTKKLILTCILFFGVVQIGMAQVKIGYANPQAILDSLPEVKVIENQIVALLEAKDSDLAIKADSLQQMIDTYEQIRGTLNDQARQSREAQILQKEQEFNTARESSLAEVQQRQNALLAPVRAKIAEAIKTVADEMGLDMVLNEETSQRSIIIFYSSDSSLNITEKVLEKLK